MKIYNKKCWFKNIIISIFMFVSIMFSCFISNLFYDKSNNITVKADGYDAIRINSYKVDATINKNRVIDFEEQINVTFLSPNLTMFYKSLPVDQNDEYFNISAECPGNKYFDMNVKSNPDVSGFIDINCVGGVTQNATWTYIIKYSMLSTSNEIKDGMLLDIVGFGSGVALNNVHVSIHFPAKPVEYNVYSGAFGSTGTGHLEDIIFDDSTNTLTMRATQLPVSHNDKYDEYMAEGVTLKFVMDSNVLKGYNESRIFTGKMAVISLIGIASLGLAIGLFFAFRKNRELITVVNIKAPDEMDPLEMGKIIDNSVDSEDITSMIFYFASKGYIKINMENEKDPILLKNVEDLPVGVPAHQKELFNGLFKNGNESSISSLTEKYYSTAQKAKMMVDAKSTKHFENRTHTISILMAALSFLLFTLVPMAVGFFRMSGYIYFFGGLMIFPVAIVYSMAVGCVNNRFKKKKGGKIAMFAGVFAVMLIASIIYTIFVGSFIVNPYEKIVISIFAWLVLIIGVMTLSRTEKYNEKLGNILGFKDFITMTSEDKIKFILKDKPELFYDILPYAQVLGVTDEWENKFKNILIEPPDWYIGSRTGIFDYYLINRMLRASARNMMVQKVAEAGTTIGRSGGGGSFGGFSGGGHGGGGFGAR